jgi:hypothetical protein
VITLPPTDLLDTTLKRYPIHLDAEYELVNNRTWKVTVLTLDYKFETWIAHLSLDGRWTLSPYSVSSDTVTIVPYERKNRGRRKRRRGQVPGHP